MKNHKQKMTSDTFTKLSKHSTQFAKMLVAQSEQAHQEAFTNAFRAGLLAEEELMSLLTTSIDNGVAHVDTTANGDTYTHIFGPGWSTSVIPGGTYANAARGSMRPCPVCGVQATVYVYHRSPHSSYDPNEKTYTIDNRHQTVVRAECHGIVVEEVGAGDVSRTLERAWNMAVEFYGKDLGNVLDILAFGAGGFPVSLEDFGA